MSKKQFEDQQTEGAMQAPSITETQWISATGFSRAENKSIADKIISDCNEGIINPLDAYIFTKSIENTVKMIQSGIQDMTFDEAAKYSEKTFIHRGCEINVRELGVKYDFSNCKDDEYDKLIQEQEKLTVKIKEREAFLKAIKTPMNIYGKVLSPAIKSSTSGIAVTIK